MKGRNFNNTEATRCAVETYLRKHPARLFSHDDVPVYYVIGASIEPNQDPAQRNFVGTVYTRPQLEMSLSTSPHKIIFKDFALAYDYLNKLNQKEPNKVFPILVVKGQLNESFSSGQATAKSEDLEAIQKDIVAVHTFTLPTPRLQLGS